MSFEINVQKKNEELSNRIFTRDLSGQGTIFMNLSLYPTTYNKETIIFLLEEMISVTYQALNISNKAGLNTFIMEIDASGVKSKHLNIQFAKLVADTMKNKFPDRLDSCLIINPPPFFEMIFDIIKTFIDKKTQKKIRIEKKYCNEKDIY